MVEGLGAKREDDPGAGKVADSGVESGLYPVSDHFPVLLIPLYGHSGLGQIRLYRL